MLDKLNELMKRLTGRKEVSDEMTSLLKNPKKRKDALKLARDTRHRLEETKARALEDIGVLGAKEKELIEKGRAETSPSQRIVLARQIQEVRAKIAEINNRIESSVAKPLKVYQVLTQLLENLVAQSEQPIPDVKQVEDLAIAAREYDQKVEQTVSMVEGLRSSMTSETGSDQDLEAILSELDSGSDAELEKEELSPDDVFSAPEAQKKKKQEKEAERAPRAPEKEVE